MSDDLPTPGEGATRLQCWFRQFKAKRLSKALQQAFVAKLNDMQTGEGVKVGGKRVQPWSQESAQLALTELNGKMTDKGTILGDAQQAP